MNWLQAAMIGLSVRILINGFSFHHTEHSTCSRGLWYQQVYEVRTGDRIQRDWIVERSRHHSPRLDGNLGSLNHWVDLCTHPHVCQEMWRERESMTDTPVIITWEKTLPEVDELRGGPFLCTSFSILSRKAFGWVGFLSQSVRKNYK